MPADRLAVHDLVARAFGGHDEARLADALRTAGDAVISMVADDGGSIIGHVMLSKLVEPGGMLALAPVSVDPARQGMSVGSALIEAALAQAREDDWGAVFVLGEPDYYGRFGFALEAAEPFSSPYPPAYMMALELRPGALSGKTGALVYPSAFG
ncbi:MAG: N-acetyltransferase [Rhodospirillales bacterium]